MTSQAISEYIRELIEAAAAADIVSAAGVEAVASLRNSGADPDMTFAAGDVAVDAASRGLDAVVVTTPDLAGRVTDALRDAELTYEVNDV